MGASLEQERDKLFNMLEGVLNGITIPTMLIRGKDSDVVDDAGVEDMKRRVPQTEVFDVNGAGHMIAGDKNDAFAGGITTFLQRHLPV